MNKKQHILALWRSCRRRLGERNLSFSFADRRIYIYISINIIYVYTSFVILSQVLLTRFMLSSSLFSQFTLSRSHSLSSSPRQRFREYRSTFSRTVLSVNQRRKKKRAQRRVPHTKDGVGVRFIDQISEGRRVQRKSLLLTNARLAPGCGAGGGCDEHAKQNLRKRWNFHYLVLFIFLSIQPPAPTLFSPSDSSEHPLEKPVTARHST